VALSTTQFNCLVSVYYIFYVMTIVVCVSCRYTSNLTDMDAIPKTVPAASTPAVESNGSNGARKKRDRFNGMSEDDVLKLTIPDQMCHNLDILIVSFITSFFYCYTLN